MEIIYGCLQLYLWIKFPQNKPKLWKFTRNLLGRQVPSIILWKFPQIIRFCGNLSGISTSFHELKFSSEYFGSLFYWEYFLRIFCFVEIYSLFSKKRSSKFSTIFPSRPFPQYSGHESRSVEEILNPPKSVWGRISTFLMSGWGFDNLSFWSQVIVFN